MTVTGVCAREGVGWWWWVLGSGGYHVQRGVVFALARVASWKNGGPDLLGLRDFDELIICCGGHVFRGVCVPWRVCSSVSLIQ